MVEVLMVELIEVRMVDVARIEVIKASLFDTPTPILTFVSILDTFALMSGVRTSSV